MIERKQELAVDRSGPTAQRAITKQRQPSLRIRKENVEARARIAGSGAFEERG